MLDIPPAPEVNPISDCKIKQIEPGELSIHHETGVQQWALIYWQSWCHFLCDRVTSIVSNFQIFRTLRPYASESHIYADKGTDTREIDRPNAVAKRDPEYPRKGDLGFLR